MPGEPHNVEAVLTGQIGAHIANQQPPRHDGLANPWQPWARDVMILAGLVPGDDGPMPWLFLACRGCGWWLGYDSQYEPQALAMKAASHVCDIDDWADPG